MTVNPVAGKPNQVLQGNRSIQFTPCEGPVLAGRSAWSIRTLLLMLVLTTMALVAALMVDSGYRTYRQAHAQAAQTALGLAQVTADSVEAFLADTRLTMSKLAERPAIRLMDPERCDSVFREFRDLYPQFANFSQANLEGELICSTLPQPGDRHTVIRETQWFRFVVQKQVFVVAPPYVGPVSGKAVSVLAHPVRDDAGRMIGSIQLPVDLATFKPVVGSSRLPQSTIITVVDSTGTIVARSQSPERFVGSHRPDSPIIAQVLARRSGSVKSFSSQGIERVYGFLPIAGTDWYAVAGISTDAVFGEAKRAALRNTVLGLAIIVFALGVALHLRKRIVASVMALRDTAQRVAGGALDARAPEDGPAEIAEVAAQFNAMLDARAAQIAALADSEADLRMLFENSVEGILRTLPDGTILRANPAVCSMLGLTEVQLQQGGQAAIVDASDPRLTRLIEERARSGQARGEITMTRVDGSRFECAVSSWLYTAADGVVRANIFLRDLTDRIQKEELRAGKEAADLANREKSAFLARMSHELRTPLNAILGFSQLLEHDRCVVSSDKAKTMIGHVRTAGMHLLELIDEVLDLSRIEAGAMALSLEPIDVGRLVEESMVLTASLAERCAVDVQFERGDSANWIRADRIRVRQVLVNVLTNAIKYNRAGGSVRLWLGGDAECLEISVQDTGAGLSAKQIKSLFQPFNRLGAERSGVEGTGLGLVIVKQLLQAMQASVTVVSEPGQGSTFTLRFPRCEPVDAVASTATEPVPAVHGTRPASRTTMLYVEDNAANAALVREVMKQRPGIELEIASDGETGLAAARRLMPDVILLDIDLPDMDGYELIRRLKQEAWCAAVPCIALSANAMQGEAQRAISAGFVAYLVKPFGVDDLLSRLDALVIGSAGPPGVSL